MEDFNVRNVKKILALVLTGAISLSGVGISDVKSVTAETVQSHVVSNEKLNEKIAPKEDDIPLQTASGRDESYVRELDGKWSFGGFGLDLKQEKKAKYSSWSQVTIPHTWNDKDGEDGGGNYSRGEYWYHKEFQAEKVSGKRIYIEFLGVNTKADVYVNGKSAGKVHKGGYTAFRYDITDKLKKGTNKLDVKVDNTVDQSIAPISADFNMYGGIYRRVYLVTVDDVHVDLNNYGSSGLFLNTGNMRSKTEPKDLGSLNVNTNLVNDSDKSKTVMVKTTISGDNAPEPVVEKVTIPAGKSKEYSKNCKVNNPTLWEGVDYSKGADNSKVGYQYTVSVEVLEDDKVIDKVSDKIGFRYFWIDSADDGESGEGFFLNGKKYPLRGVNRHSFLAGVGSAMTEKQHKEDMDIMLDLGVNTVRLCHYPQTDYFYDLCDSNGIIVWTEIPLVNIVGAAKDFNSVTKKQLTELIREQYNRPSVCFWGLENEIGNGTSLTNATSNTLVAKAKKLMYELDNLAHEEDTTGRYTTQAVNRDYSMNYNKPDSVNSKFSDNTGWKSDTVAWNIYPGWYPDANFYGTFDDVMKRKTVLDSRPMGISEYGWGANVTQHELYPQLGKNDLSSGGTWHPEEYQNIMNEEALAYINTHDELWGTYYWVMFDFAVDSRYEGSQPALNDKGLVTANRKIKKDSYYLYKANWNKNDAFTYITSRRFKERESSKTYVKVYSNCDEVELFINDKSLGMMESKGNGVFLTENAELGTGDNVIKAVGHYKDDAEKEYTDTCIWTRKISDKAELESEILSVDTKKNTITLNGDITLDEFKKAVKGINYATYHVFDGERELTEDTGLVVQGMKVKVLAEDGKKTSVYTIIPSNICTGKKITCSSEESGNEAVHAVDGNSTTQWVAANGDYPQNVVVDLNDEYFLSNITIDWYQKNETRYYLYNIEVSEDGVHYKKVKNHADNTTPGTVSDKLNLIKARYIRVNVTGCNENGWAGIGEIKASGYMLTSDKYAIDHENKLIIADEIPEAGLAESTFAENIKLTGNYSQRINLSSGWIHDGNTVDILNADGKKITTYTICTNATKKKHIASKQSVGNVKKFTVKVLKNGSIKIKIAKIKGADGYEIVYGTNKKITKTVKKITVKSGSYTIKKLKKGSNYYAKVRAYKIYNGKKIFSKKYTSVKQILKSKTK